MSAFLPHAGRDYTSNRNYDRPGHPHVSVLSPYLRHRLVTEEDVLTAVLGRFSLSSAEKFVQEVFWRTYWKGWLEMRPGVWDTYRTDLNHTLDRIATESGLRDEWEAACTGSTGIDAFDHWARELVDTGYLHNHARMWFASIWIFTLRLPWVLGADFFMRHLLDGDAASNTLSWRWVAGLQTQGKNYLARASNIAKYTDGRFTPRGQLDETAPPLAGARHPDRRPIPPNDLADLSLRTGLLLTEDDLSPGYVLAEIRPVATALVSGAAARSPLKVSGDVKAFTDAAIDSCAKRYGARLSDDVARLDPSALIGWAQTRDLQQIVLPYVPVGPARDTLAKPLAALETAGIRIARVQRPYDAVAWPNATAGFFKFKSAIPGIIDCVVPQDRKSA